MGHAGSLRRRVEDAANLRISDLVPRHRPAFGFSIDGTMTVRDPATAKALATVAYSGEVSSGHGRITFTHTPAGQRWPSSPYVVSIVAVDHPFGPRFRFRCPEAGALVDVLHLPAGADQFASRKAHGLSYASQSMRAPRRAEARARQIRVDLGGTPNLTAPFPERPARMWDRTYLRQRAEAEIKGGGIAASPVLYSHLAR